MKRITTFVGFAVFAFAARSPAAMAEQSNGTQPARLNAPREQAPVPAIKPIQRTGFRSKSVQRRMWAKLGTSRNNGREPTALLSRA